MCKIKAKLFVQIRRALKVECTILCILYTNVSIRGCPTLASFDVAYTSTKQSQLGSPQHP